jgi:hypothetical protein
MTVFYNLFTLQLCYVFFHLIYTHALSALFEYLYLNIKDKIQFNEATFLTAKNKKFVALYFLLNIHLIDLN